MTLPQDYIPLLPEVKSFLARDPLHPYINGQPTHTADGETFATLDPSSGEHLAHVGRGKVRRTAA